MILADTSVWIEFLKGKELIYSYLSFLLEHGEISGLEVIFGELLQGAKSKREREMILAYAECIEQLDEKGNWLNAGLNASANQLKDKGIGLIDSYLLTNSQSKNIKLWTLDKKLSAATENLYEPSLSAN